tara:strand:+ start:14642 stop:14824 length:183 start_codon:yes stop_codon:yes gene_type:complete
MSSIVQPRKIVSPSGSYVSPKLIVREVEGKVVTEAHWYDPLTNIIFHKGTVSVEEKVPVE